MSVNPPLAAAVPLFGRRPTPLGVFGRTAVLAVVATCLFAAAAGAQIYEVLHAITSGAYPSGLIQGTDGNLYGTTYSGGASSYGTIFKIDTTGSTFTTLHSFAGSDGSYPYAGLIQGTDGNLYGTTYSGGASNYGTIFKVDTTGSTFTTLHSFAGSDGTYPEASLMQGTDGNLYGTTANGGANDNGTIFKVDTTGSTFTTLHSFAGYPTDGGNPYAGLIQASDGNLYGTTFYGGAIGAGTVFKIDTSGTAFTTLHSFAGYPTDGANLYAGLIQGTDGNLYGTTYSGGASNAGTIFKIDTSGTAFTTLHNFVGSDGQSPWGGVIQGIDGNLYGTTTYQGVNGYGTIFKTDTNGLTLMTLHSFLYTDGGYPETALIQGTDGNFYGTTALGGSGDGGVVFRLTLPTFQDVPTSYWAYSFIETIVRAGITAGCGGSNYCPEAPVTRAQMAVFLLRAEHGSSYVPPTCTGFFADVSCPGGFAADWIERLSTEGITAGCGGGKYCPDSPVTRAQMAVFLLKAEHGPAYAPPACTPPGLFGDVACPGGFAVDWIEQLSTEGITAGCGGGNYCPDASSTRGQMAVFLVTTFGL